MHIANFKVPRGQIQPENRLHYSSWRLENLKQLQQVSLIWIRPSMEVRANAAASRGYRMVLGYDADKSYQLDHITVAQ